MCMQIIILHLLIMRILFKIVLNVKRKNEMDMRVKLENLGSNIKLERVGFELGSRMLVCKTLSSI